MSNLDFDIIIVGGGLAGLTQTVLLAQNGFDVLCIDKENKTDISPTDARTTAISYGSHLILKNAGIWDDLIEHACPIEDIQILDGTSPVLLDFPIDEVKQPAFGWIIENRFIRKALSKAIETEKSATHLTGHSVQDFQIDEKTATVILGNNKKHTANLIIGADGRQSFTREWMNVGTREWSYNQQAIVTIVTHEKPHNNVAIEHFRSEGPFAILPMLDGNKGEHKSSIVWTDHSNAALNYDDKTFLTALNARFPDLYGEVLSNEKRFCYPLNFSHAFDYIKPRMALIADAAHGIHPIAGQGLNLGFRDIAALNDILKTAKNNNEDIGDLKILERYQRARQKDNIAMAAATDLLNKTFSNKFPPLKLARKVGLKVINKIKPTKKYFMRKAMGI